MTYRGRKKLRSKDIRYIHLMVQPPMKAKIKIWRDQTSDSDSRKFVAHYANRTAKDLMNPESNALIRCDREVALKTGKVGCKPTKKQAKQLAEKLIVISDKLASTNSELTLEEIDVLDTAIEL